MAVWCLACALFMAGAASAEAATVGSATTANGVSPPTRGTSGVVSWGVGPNTVPGTFDSSSGTVDSNSSITGIATDGTTGYWEVSTSGGVFAFNVPYYGSLPGDGVTPAAPIVGIEATSNDEGYWLVGANGAVYAFGDASYDGSIPGLPASEQSSSQTVAMVVDPGGGGYWLVTADGGVYSFGSVPFYGSLPGEGISSEGIVSAAPYGGGYAMVSNSGVVYRFTASGFAETPAPASFNVYQDPVVAMSASTNYQGWWLVDRTGQVYAQNTSYKGNVPDEPPIGPIEAISGFGTAGYNIVGADGGTFNFNLPYEGNVSVSSELSPSRAQAIAFTMLPQGGWGDVFDPSTDEGYSCQASTASGQWCNGLLPLWNVESGWKWSAYNSGSTCNSAGNHAYGIPQACHGPSMCYTTNGQPPCPNSTAWKTNAWTQIMWGFWYIGTGSCVQGDCPYGSPEAAWAHEEQYGWYVVKP